MCFFLSQVLLLMYHEYLLFAYLVSNVAVGLFPYCLLTIAVPKYHTLQPSPANSRPHKVIAISNEHC